MRSPRAARLLLAMMGVILSSSLAWAVKAQLETRVGESGLSAIGDALWNIAGKASLAPSITTLLLAIGMTLGYLIGAAARSIDVRLKRPERWPLRMLRREVRFTRFVCARPWMRFLVPDLWEDLRFLSDQLERAGLAPIPAVEPSDKKAMRAVSEYLSLIAPLISEERMPYAKTISTQHVAKLDPPEMVPSAKPRRKPAATKARAKRAAPAS